MRKSSKLLVAVAAAGLVAAGGSAFTASNTLAGDNAAGYGTAAVSGASTSSIEHTLDATGVDIVSTSLVFSEPISATSVVEAGFNGTRVTCTVAQGLDANPDTAICDYSAVPFDNATATSFEVVTY